MKSTAAVPALLEAYKIASVDVTYGAREAILTAVNAIEPATGRQMLRQALMDKDWALRMRAATLLRQQGITDVDASMRPAPSDIVVGDKRVLALLTPQYSPHAYLDTDKGTIEVELAVLDAPLTVENFIALARKGYFNGLTIHRVVPDFVIQDGDPRGDGEGGPGYTIRDEINERPYLRGTVGMALAGKDTGGSQFFITHSPQPHLDARYTVFGHVVNGMDVVDRIAAGDIVRGVRIWDGVTER
jgi:cyclophilin family peptidyl-prolyl cis-trans isomerase